MRGKCAIHSYRLWHDMMSKCTKVNAQRIVWNISLGFWGTNSFHSWVPAFNLPSISGIHQTISHRLLVLVPIPFLYPLTHFISYWVTNQIIFIPHKRVWGVAFLYISTRKMASNWRHWRANADSSCTFVRNLFKILYNDIWYAFLFLVQSNKSTTVCRQSLMNY